MGKQCKIKAVCDIDLRKAQELAASIGPDVAVYNQHGDLLANEEINVVSVCTPPFAHKNPTIDALTAGKHVLCEKPMAASLEECDAMISAVSRY